ncbi:mannosyltransferase [Aestuariivivens sediminicola]|uniref:mannosyltransferase n=1 Tax=Aestuariivivens sediminicola TaxID=2913560 RepID=UPI001F55D2F1|nr:mannosyltransferase [Aestuariivivens sediminicola]
MFLNPSIQKSGKLKLFLVSSSALLYFVFAYDLIRTDYTKLIGLYTLLFFLFYGLIRYTENSTRTLTYVAFAYRALFFLAIPNLSQDFYRFIWDGRVLLEGFNPYLHSVVSFIKTVDFPIPQAGELVSGMGSLNASHFSNYPPMNQLCFAVAALFFKNSILGSVIVMRLIIIAADFGTLYFGKKLLQKLNLPVNSIFLYVLNPFIIIELTGNLHFEGVMVFFFIWSLYLLHSGKRYWAAVVLGLSISVKLIPLLFLPLFLKWSVFANPKNKAINASESTKIGVVSVQALKNLFLFYAIVLFTVIILFVPFYSTEFVMNYTDTLALWFKNFEFNASLYYIARAIGYTFRGYNEITVIGTYIPYVILLFTFLMTFLRANRHPQQVFTTMLFVLTFYFFSSTTVHPWYLTTLLVLSLFTPYKYPLVWSYVIILSYLAYVNTNTGDKTENLWIIGLEYTIVYSVLIWEIFIKKKV